MGIDLIIWRDDFDGEEPADAFRTKVETRAHVAGSLFWKVADPAPSNRDACELTPFLPHVFRQTLIFAIFPPKAIS